MTITDEPTVAWRRADDPTAPLVVLLHGRGSNEADIVGLADHLPTGPTYAAVRAPIAEGGGYAWFANRGIGRQVVLVVHGDQDHVIPRDLLDRTWATITAAGERTTAVRDPGGHGLSPAARDDVRRWLEATVATTGSTS
jgi:predicted esterase